MPRSVGRRASVPAARSRTDSERLGAGSGGPASLRIARPRQCQQWTRGSSSTARSSTAPLQHALLQLLYSTRLYSSSTTRAARVLYQHRSGPALAGRPEIISGGKVHSGGPKTPSPACRRPPAPHGAAESRHGAGPGDPSRHSAA